MSLKVPVVILCGFDPLLGPKRVPCHSEKPTVHATVIWDSVTINNIFVLSPLSSKAGHFHIHASLSIILAIDNI